MAYWHVVWQYITDHFDKVTALSNIALAVISAFLSLLTLWLTYIILRFTALPKVGIHLNTRGPFSLRETVDLSFTVFNKGHWFSHPPATGIRIYFNVSDTCELQSLRYGSDLQKLDSQVKKGKGSHIYLRAEGIRVFYEEPGEKIVLRLKLPSVPGKCSLRIALSCAEGGYVVYRKRLKVRDTQRTVSIPDFSTAPATQWSLSVSRRFDTPAVVPSNSSFVCPVLNQIVPWEKLYTFNPAAVVRENKVFLLYRAEDESGDTHRGSHTSRIGLAESADGIHFTCHPEPVLFPSKDDQIGREWPGGCEDPRIVESPEGLFVLTYTQWNRKHWTVGVATSSDLITWCKHGPAFGESVSNADVLSYKSAGIVTQKRDGRLIAAQVNGKYLMYWGEGEIHLATSPDLLHWEPVRSSDSSLVSVMCPRAGRFDSALVEVGAPPIITEDGILLLYNGMNRRASGDATLNDRTYAAGQALFDSTDPSRLLARLDQPFMSPEFPFETKGQYAEGTTFVEGLVFFNGAYLLYYGAADSAVGVASCSEYKSGQQGHLPDTGLHSNIRGTPS